jgi:general secretion pathway protein B
MKFAGHTYSAIAGDRLIIINNGIKREGDAVGPGLKLEEITWDGVILNYRGLRFQVVTTGS